jgi:lysine-specific histone demethylase 1
LDLQVALLFPHAFWADDVDSFGRVNDTMKERGRFFLFYRSVTFEATSGVPLHTDRVAVVDTPGVWRPRCTTTAL